MKFKSFMAAHSAIVKDVTVSTCLLGASAGVVFGVSAGMFNINYMKLEGAQERLSAYTNHSYASEKIKSAWNMNANGDIPGYQEPIWSDIKSEYDTNPDAKKWWDGLHGNATPLWTKYTQLGMDKAEGEKLTADEIKARYAYTSMVIDGATHTTMDRSFNQSLYEGLVDFVQNDKCTTYDSESETDPVKYHTTHSYKPSQDNTTDFVNTYASVIKEHDVVGLAGFNHSTPLNSMMTHENGSALVTNPDPEINKLLNSTGLILLDSNIANNQNIASVQFRADQPGFLTGLATCQYFYNNLDMYHDKFQDIAVGAYGGVAIPTVIIYIGGFQRGIEFFNHFILSEAITQGSKYYFGEEQAKDDDIRAQALLKTFTNLVEHSKYKDEINALRKSIDYSNEAYKKLYEEYSIKVIKLGAFSENFSGTFAAGDAIGITKQLLNRGASAIIAVAGPQSLDTAQEIRNQNSKCIVVGVDSAMEDGDFQRFHNGSDEKSKTKTNEKDPYMDKTVDLEGNHSSQANAIIKFSAIKDIKSVSKQISRLCAEGKNWDVDAEAWEHDVKPDWSNAYTLQPSDFDGEIIPVNPESRDSTKSNDEIFAIKISKIHHGVLEGKKQLIIPEKMKWSDGKEYYVGRFGKQSFKGEIDSLEQIQFKTPFLYLEDEAFAMSDSTKSQMNFISFNPSEYFSIITEFDPEDKDALPFLNWPKTHNGLVDFTGITSKDFLAEKDVIENFTNLGLADWFVKKPNPNKSICGPGFQTCSNIQNGLISISWDGFYPLLQALSHLNFSVFGRTMPFNEVWRDCASRYLREAKTRTNIDKEYEWAIFDIQNSMIFRRTDSSGKNTPLFDNYNHTMAILGLFLNNALAKFDSSMTLVPVDDDDLSQGFTTLPEGESREMSIIDWLDYNMYMME